MLKFYLESRQLFCWQIHNIKLKLNAKEMKNSPYRHGQTDFNQSGIVQGSGVNASLNEIGQKQAAAFYKKFKDYPFDVIYPLIKEKY